MVGTYYRPPGQQIQSRNAFLDAFNDSVSLSTEENPFAIIIMGDFNDKCDSWYSDHSDSELGLSLFNMVDRNGLHQLVSTPTRISDTSQSLLDLILTDSPHIFSNIATLSPISTSDHSVVYCNLEIKLPRSFYTHRIVWDFKNGNFAALNNSLRQAPFHLANELSDNVSDVVSFWFELYKSTIEEFIPHKQVTVKSNDKPWITHEFKVLIRKRNRLWRRFKKTGNPNHFHIYKMVRNAALSLNRRNIKSYYEKLEMQLSKSSNPKVWWKKFKTVISSKDSHSIPPINNNGVLFDKDQQKATLFNEYFAAQCQVHGRGRNHQLPPFRLLTTATLGLPQLSEANILQILKDLPTNKATGPDGIGNYIIKATAYIPSFM